MDDGNRNIHWHTKKNGLNTIHSRNLVMNIQGFSFEEAEIIKEYFSDKWFVNVKVYKQRNKPILYINAENSNKFINIIEPHIIPSLQYKIDLMYNVTHPLTKSDRQLRMSLGQSDANSIVG
jgi:hypothetical protein